MGDVKIRGIRQPIPAGHVIGRLSAGTGDAELISVADLSYKVAQSGVVATPGSNNQTIQGTANRITVTNGSGTPVTIDIAGTYVGQSSITTLGTVTTGTWNAGYVASHLDGNGFSPAGTSTAGWAITSNNGDAVWNGAGAVDIWNTVQGVAGFAFHQKTAAGYSLVSSIDSDGTTYSEFELFAEPTGTTYLTLGVTTTQVFFNSVGVGFNINADSGTKDIHFDGLSLTLDADTPLKISGHTSGTVTLTVPAVASGTITLPAGTTDFSSTGGASQVVKQTSSGGAFTVAKLVAADIDNTAAITPTGGIAAAGGFAVSPRLVHTGGQTGLSAASSYTAQTPVTTEFYFAEIFIPANMSVTGVAVFNSATISGNMKIGLFDSSGTLLKQSVSTAMSGTTTYQRVAFSGGAYAAVGPATYYIGVFYDNNTVRPNTFTSGNFGASNKTGQTYATGFTNITPPTTFLTALGPIASLY